MPRFTSRSGLRPGPVRPVWLVLAVALFASWLAAPPAQAQDAPPPTVIPFDDAVRMALERNYQLRQAANAVEADAIGVARNRMEFFPDLSASVSGGRTYGREFSNIQGGFVNTSESASFGASAGVNLFNGFRDDATLDQAQRQVEASSRTLRRRRQDITFDVMRRFIELAQRREIVRVQEENVTLRGQQLEQTEALIEVGERAASELYQQQAAEAEAEQQLLNAERDVQITETELARLLALDPLNTYQFEAQAIERLSEAELTPGIYELRTLIQQALAGRADLDAQEATIAATEQGVRAARADYYPRLDLSAGYGSNWSSALPDFNSPVPGTGVPPRQVTITSDEGEQLMLDVPGTGEQPEYESVSFLDQLDDQRSGRVSLSLSIPLFDRFQRRYNVDQAQVQVQNARFQKESLRRDVAAEVQQAYLDYQNARKALDVTETRLTAAEQAQRAAEERYELGAATYVELAQANTDFVRAASERVRAKYDFLFQKKRIDYVTGTLEPEQSSFE